MNGSTTAMLRTERADSPSAQPITAPISPVTWKHLLLLAAAFAGLYWMNLQRLWQWTNPSSGDPNWGHAFFIPLISLAYLLEHRDRLKKTPVQPSSAGLLFIAGGIALFICGIGIGANFVQFGPYVQDVGMLTTLFGTVLSVLGWQIVRVSIFPIAYLLRIALASPMSMTALTVLLQHVAASASVRVLQLTGMNLDQAGNTLQILGANGVARPLNVAEACSGMRSLITFIALGLAVAFLSARPLWQKIVISASAIPIAIACNVMRIVGEGLLDQHVSQSFSHGFVHSAVGVVLLAPGFLLFLVVGRVLDRLPFGKRTAKVPSSLTHRQSRDGNRGISFGQMYPIVISILLVGAVTFTAAGHFLQLHFVKIPVPLNHPLTDLPSDLGPWHQFGGNEAISDDLEQTLGATQYVFREYIDGRVAGDQTIDALRRDSSQFDAMRMTIAQSHPQALVRVAVTYYTGHVDAVIHQSERCNLADGIASSIESQPAVWDLGNRPLNVRVVHLIHDSTEEKGPHYICLLLLRANGHAEEICFPWARSQPFDEHLRSPGVVRED